MSPVLDMPSLKIMSNSACLKGAATFVLYDLDPYPAAHRLVILLNVVYTPDIKLTDE
jgi:hypothetical protein